MKMGDLRQADLVATAAYLVLSKDMNTRTYKKIEHKFLEATK